MKILNFIIGTSFLILCFFASSCTRDEIMVEPQPVITQSGVYILSEGGFSAGSSKLSYYDFDKDSLYSDIFRPGSLGLFPDGIAERDGILYITEQGNFGAPGKIYKLDSNGIVLASAGIGLNPYAVTETNGRLFVSNGPANNVSVVNRENLQVLATIPVRNYPQEILGIGNRVFVCNAGSFSTGDDSTVSVIDAGNNQVVGTLLVGKNPSTLAKSNDGKLLVGCPGDSSSAVIFKIDPITLTRLETYGNLRYGLSKDISVGSNEILYFIAGSLYSDEEIVSYSMTTGQTQFIISKPSGYVNYGLAYDKIPERLYVCAAAADFTSSGRFRVYSTAGILLKDFAISSGIAPRRMLIKR
jgi:YVTN family beta-propeller protein